MLMFVLPSVFFFFPINSSVHLNPHKESLSSVLPQQYPQPTAPNIERSNLLQVAVSLPSPPQRAQPTAHVTPFPSLLLIRSQSPRIDSPRAPVQQKIPSLCYLACFSVKSGLKSSTIVTAHCSCSKELEPPCQLNRVFLDCNRKQSAEYKEVATAST